MYEISPLIVNEDVAVSGRATPKFEDDRFEVKFGGSNQRKFLFNC